jgi:phage tail sheath gpL-like
MANTISPPNYPSSNRTPVVAFSLDASNANTSVADLKTLLIGQMFASGTSPPNVPFLASSQAVVDAMTGPGSMLSNMYNTYLGDDGFAEIWALPVFDDPAAAKGVSTMTVSGPATATGTLALYVAGTLVPVAVTMGDSASTIATNVVGAMALQPPLPATATTSGGVVTFTAVHGGIAAADIDLRLNYLGAINGQTTPAGVSVAFATITAGTTDPNLTPALSALTGQYAFIASPYSGASQFASLQAVVSDINGTWSWLSNTGGGIFSAYKNTYAGVQSYGTTVNLQHFAVLGISDTPTTVANIAASYTAVCANSLRVDPALPLTAIVMTGIQAPPVHSVYTRLMRNVLLYDGITTFTTNSAGQVILEIAATTYQKTPSGAADNSYFYVNTLYTLQAIIAAWKTAFQTKYARVKLVDDATPIRPGTNTVNPTAIRSEVIAQYQNAADAGLVQDVPQFIKTVATQQVSPNQVNVYAPVQIATGLYQLIFDLAFTL